MSGRLAGSIKPLLITEHFQSARRAAPPRLAAESQPQQLLTHSIVTAVGDMRLRGLGLAGQREPAKNFGKKSN